MGGGGSWETNNKQSTQRHSEKLAGIGARGWEEGQPMANTRTGVRKAFQGQTKTQTNLNPFTHLFIKQTFEWLHWARYYA